MTEPRTAAGKRLLSGMPWHNDREQASWGRLIRAIEDEAAGPYPEDDVKTAVASYRAAIDALTSRTCGHGTSAAPMSGGMADARRATRGGPPGHLRGGAAGGGEPMSDCRHFWQVVNVWGDKRRDEWHVTLICARCLALRRVKRRHPTEEATDA